MIIIVIIIITIIIIIIIILYLLSRLVNGSHGLMWTYCTDSNS